MRLTLVYRFLLMFVVFAARTSYVWGQSTDAPVSSEEINGWIVQLQHDENRNPSASPSASKLIEQGTASFPAIRALLLESERLPSRSSIDTYAVRLPGSDKDIRMSELKYSRACNWALYVLVEIGPEALPVLVEAARLGNRNTEVAWPAGEALRRIHPAGVEELVKLLDSPQEYVRHLAIYHLSTNCPYFSSQIPGGGRLATLAQLGQLEQMVNVWIAASKNPDDFVRCKALCAMENAGKYEERVLPILIKALEDRNETVRLGACDALADVGEDSEAALDGLLQALHKYPDSSNLSYALAARGKAAIPGLLEALKSRNPAVRGTAADTLGRIGPPAAKYVPEIVEAMKGVELEYSSGEHLANIGPEIIPVLEQAYKHGSRDTRQAIVNHVEKLGGAVVPLLIKALKDSDPYVRRDAAQSLGNIKGTVPVEAIPHLEAALKHTESRYAAATALCSVGPKAIPALARCLQQGNADQRGAIVSAVRSELRYGDKRAYVDLVPKLVTVLDDAGYGGHERVLEIFEEMGTEAVPGLVAVIEDSNTADRKRALTLLKRSFAKAGFLKPKETPTRRVPSESPSGARSGFGSLLNALFGRNNSPPPVAEEPQPQVHETPETVREAPNTVDVPQIVELLGKQLPDDDVTIRLRAVEILGILGPDSASTVPLLVDRLRDEQTCIRIPATKALGRIGAAAVPALIDGLQDEDIRHYAANALWQVGASAVPALLELQKSKDRHLRNLAGDIIVRQGGAAVGPLTERLKDEDAQVRRRVTFALGEIGEPAVSGLIEALKSEDAEVRMLAADGLGRIGPGAGRAVSQLIVAMEDEDERVRLVAVDALGAIGPDAEAAADKLAAVLEDRILRARAAESLGKLEEAAVPVLLKAIGHKDQGVREAAIYAIGRAGKDNEDVVEPLVSVLKGKSETARLLAADSLGRVGAVAVPALAAALNDNELPERWLAALALGRMGEDAVDGVSALADALQDEDEQVRSAAAHALSEIGPKAADALPALKECLTKITGEARMNVGWALWTIAEHSWSAQVLSQTLKDDELHVRVASAIALGKIGPDAAGAVPKLIDAMEDESPKVQAAAALALGQIGAKAKTAVPALEKSLEMVTGETRLNVGWALWEISEHPWAVTTLEQTLKSEDAGVRVAAATFLGRIGKPAASAAPALTLALQDRHPRVRSAAALALGEIGPDASDSTEALTEVLSESVGESRLNTAWAIWQLREDKSAISDLIATLSDPNPQVRYGAAAALGQIGSDAKESVPALALALGDGSPKVRAMAAGALSQMGKDAAPATPALLEAVRDEDELVQKYAASALLGTGAKFYYVIPTLVQALEDESPALRESVAVAIVGKPEEETELTPIDRLKELLREGNVNQRCTAAMLLATRDEAKNYAVSDLNTAMHEDKNHYVQWCAKWSLSILQP